MGLFLLEFLEVFLSIIWSQLTPPPFFVDIIPTRHCNLDIQLPLHLLYNQWIASLDPLETILFFVKPTWPLCSSMGESAELFILVVKRFSSMPFQGSKRLIYCS